jgi:hypothetical protein
MLMEFSVSTRRIEFRQLITASTQPTTNSPADEPEYSLAVVSLFTCRVRQYHRTQQCLLQELRKGLLHSVNERTSAEPRKMDEATEHSRPMVPSAMVTEPPQWIDTRSNGHCPRGS